MILFFIADGDAAVIFLKSIRALKYSPDVYLQYVAAKVDYWALARVTCFCIWNFPFRYPVGKGMVTSHFRKKNEQRLKDRSRRGQNHTLVYNPSDFDQSHVNEEEAQENEDDKAAVQNKQRTAQVADEARSSTPSSHSRSRRKMITKRNSSTVQSAAKASIEPTTEQRAVARQFVFLFCRIVDLVHFLILGLVCSVVF